MAIFGVLWYGGPQQYLYVSVFPRLIGNGTARQAALTAVADCLISTPIVFTPSFYFIVGGLRGQSYEESLKLLKQEFVGTSLGQAAFWMPVQYINFLFVPVYLQTFVVSAANLVNKTWLSWFSTRSERAAALNHGEPAAVQTMTSPSPL